MSKNCGKKLKMMTYRPLPMSNRSIARPECSRRDDSIDLYWFYKSFDDSSKTRKMSELVFSMAVPPLYVHILMIFMPILDTILESVLRLFQPGWICWFLQLLQCDINVFEGLMVSFWIHFWVEKLGILVRNQWTHWFFLVLSMTLAVHRITNT